MDSVLSNYRELIVWQRAIDLVKAVYLVTKALPQEETYALSSQLRRAAISIPSNIAEGYGRNNRKEYIQFLGIAKGSAAEVDTQLVLVTELYPNISTVEAQVFNIEVQKMLSTLVAKLTPKPYTLYPKP